jgi:hypothetical protein
LHIDGNYPPPQGRIRMDHEQRPELDRLNSPFTTSVSAHPAGGWATVINLGDGATLTKVFPTEPEAEQYGDELADWLANRPSEYEGR